MLDPPPCLLCIIPTQRSTTLLAATSLLRGSPAAAALLHQQRSASRPSYENFSDLKSGAAPADNSGSGGGTTAAMAGPAPPAWPILPHLPGQPLPFDSHEHLHSGRLSGKLVQAMMSRHGHLVFSSGAGGGSTSGVMRGGGTAAVPGGSSHLAPLSSLPVPTCSLAELMAAESMPGRRFSDGLSSLDGYRSRRTSAEMARPRGSMELTRSRGSAEIARSLSGAPLMSLAAAEDAATGHHSGSKVAKLALKPGGPQAASGGDDFSGASDMDAARGDNDRATPTGGSGRRRSIGSRPVPAGVTMLQQGLRIREDSLEIIAQSPAAVVDDDGRRAGASTEIVACYDGDGNSSPQPLSLTDAPLAAAPPAMGRDGTGIISHERLRVSLHQSQGNIAVRGGSVQHHPSSQQLEASPSSAALTATPSGIVGAAAAASSTHPPPPAAATTTAAPVLDDWMSEWGAAAAAGEEEGEPTEAVPPPATAASRGDVGCAPAGGAAQLSASSKVNQEGT